MTERGHRDSIVSAAVAHADAIRRTLVKREHGRALPTGGNKPQQKHHNKRAEPALILDGPIYSTDYWRAWKSRSRMRRRRGNGSPSVSDPTLWPKTHSQIRMYSSRVTLQPLLIHFFDRPPVLGTTAW